MLGKEEKKKKAEKEDSAKKAGVKEKDEESDSEGVHIAAITIRMADPTTKMNHYEYDTGASHHITKKLWRLQDIKDVNLKGKAHDNTLSICRKQGTLVLQHNEITSMKLPMIPNAIRYNTMRYS